MAANNGQTINDRILAARHSLAGQGLAKSVCKATTEELIGPKKKHLDYLLHCTEEPNVSIPTLANLLIERTQSTNWIVVFKGLVTIHHLMCYGNERFVQYLASSNANFQLSSFLDKSGVQDRLQSVLVQAVSLDPHSKASIEQIKALAAGGTVRGYDMSPFIRRYAKYLSEKAISYRTVAFDFCKVKRGKDGGTLRSMSADKLLKTLPVLQNQVDALVDFEVTTNDLNNGVINSAFMLLFRDLIRLFACYNDGIINLLEKYFEMSKKNARDALDIYKKFLIRMDRVADFLKVAENVGIEKGDLPDLAKAPSSLLEALEAHLANLEGRKPGSAATTPTGASRVNVESAVSVLSSTSSAFGTSQIDEKLQQQLLAEEELAMAKYKEQHKATNPFSIGESSSTGTSSTDNGGTPNILDLFGCSAPPPAPSASTASTNNSNGNKSSDDLLQLSGGNPFASVIGANTAASSSVNATSQPAFNNSPFSGPFGGNAPGPNANGFSSQPFPPMSNNTVANVPNTGMFASDDAFRNAFGANNTLQAPTQQSNNVKDMGATFFGDILQPQGNSAFGGTSSNNQSSTTGSSSNKVITGDLDASLANLTSNLNLGGQTKNLGSAQQPKGPPMGAGMTNLFSNTNINPTGSTASLSSNNGLIPTQLPLSLYPPVPSVSGPAPNVQPDPFGF